MILERTRYGFLSRLRRPEGIAPRVTRNTLKFLGASPKVIFEASVSVSLVLTIAMFLFFPDFEPATKITIRAQELVSIEEIEHTRQQTKAPPPPRPPIPIEAPSDEILEDVELASSELDVLDEVAPPPQSSGDDDEAYFVAVEEMPQVIGGVEAITRVLQYPDIALRAQVQGKVFILAYVNELGEVTRAEILKGIGAGCDEAAKEAVKKVKFIPGKQRGAP
ncbi:MAG TPA: energy transducer TonB, partial [Bacteroidota bacterium]